MTTTNLSNSPQRIVLMTTGGTIAGLTPEEGAPYQAGSMSGAALLQDVSRDSSVEIEIQEIANIDSKDANPVLWLKLASAINDAQRNDKVQAIVLTHGTDTLEETAFALHLLLPITKPLVFTAAMRPADAVDADGPQNLSDALAVAQAMSTRGLVGMVLVTAGTIHDPVQISKWDTTEKDALHSGIELGQVIAGQVKGLSEQSSELALTTSALPFVSFDVNQDASNWPIVEIVPCYAGVSPKFLQCMLEEAIAAKHTIGKSTSQSTGLASTNPMSGIVLAGTGQGTFPKSFLPWIAQAKALGIPVVRSTRVPHGDVDYRHGMDDADLGTVAAQGLNPWKARILLQYLLFSQQKTPNLAWTLAQLQAAFDRY